MARANTLSRRDFLNMGLWAIPSLQALQPRNNSRLQFLSYEQASPVLQSGRIALPVALSGLSDTRLRSAWPQWLQNRDRDIRSRLLRGEEDTLVNFILFGVSFTSRQRVSPTAANSAQTTALLDGRVQDFLKAIPAPGTNERLSSLKKLLAGLGYNTNTPAQRERLRTYLMQNVSRVAAEQQRYGATVDRALQNDTSASSSSTSQIYKDRGLSIDTDFRPNFAIEEALRDLKRRGALSSVRRAAVIGPGLDFTDKDLGFDFYPLQTLQPFALVDSLLRLELARPQDLRVTTFDISAQTLDHISQAIRLAGTNRPYDLQLVLDKSRPCNAPVLAYWQRFGDRIGSATTPLPVPPQIQNVDHRAIRIRPEIVRMLDPQALNIVSQHLNPASAQKYDLIIGTNILVYYDTFEQALSLLNIESMLTSRGVFLSNDLQQEYPGVKLHATRNVGVEYSKANEDRIQIFSNSMFTPQLPPD